MPSSRISGRHSAFSRFTKASNSAGLQSAASMPSVSKRPRTSSALTPARSAAADYAAAPGHHVYRYHAQNMTGVRLSTAASSSAGP